MAKINDMMNEIEQLLSCNDLSNNPHSKKLASDYAAICRDLNKDLQECKSLFQMGAYAEARRLNSRSKPPFTERFRILNFSGRAEWIRLCNMYSWDVPPMLDSDTVRQLNENGDQKEISIEELQNQWRRIIRDGSVREKLILARKIYAIDKSSVWKSNLLNIERTWVNMLKKSAENAFNEKRLEELIEICNELKSSELLQPQPESFFDKYQDDINAFKRSKTEEEKNALLDEIAADYMALDLASLEKSLEKWGDMQKNSFFSVSKEEEKQVNDARNFLLEKIAERNAKEEFSRLQNQLEMLLNENGDPEEINKVYHSLQQFDKPIKKLLENRMAEFYEMLELERKRKHVRSCISWGVSAVVIAIGIFAAVMYFQAEKDLRDACASMQKHINENNYSLAIEFYKSVRKKSSSIADKAALKALHEEAQKMYADAVVADKEFVEKCELLEKKYLNDENILHPAIGKIFLELEELVKILPIEKKNMKSQLQVKYENLKAAKIAANEIKFRNEVLNLQKEWSVFFNSFNKVPTHDNVKKKNILERRGSALLNEYKSKISAELYAEWEKNLADNTVSFGKYQKNREEMMTKTKNLYQPVSAEQYFLALRSDVNISSETVNDFNKALQQLVVDEPIFRIINNVYDEAKLSAIASQYTANPFCRELNRRNQAAHNTAAFRNTRKNIFDSYKKLIMPQHAVKEIVLYDKNQQYHFYFNNPDKDIDIEKTWDNKRIKSLQLFFLHSGNNIKHSAVFKVDDKKIVEKIAELKKEHDRVNSSLKKKDRTKFVPPPENELFKYLEFVFVPNQKYETLPPTMMLKDHEILFDMTKIRTASQNAVLQANAENLEKGDIASILKSIIQVAEDDTVTNIYAKVSIMRTMLEFLPQDKQWVYYNSLQPLYELLKKYSTAERAWWHNPAAAFKYPEDSVNFPQELAKLDLRKIFAKIMLSEKLSHVICKYPPLPGGVFFREGNTWRLHSFQFNLTDCNTLFISTAAANPQDNKMYALSAIDFVKPVPHEKLSKDIASELYNGQIVYFASSLDSWKSGFKSAIEELKKENFAIPENADGIVWPEYWPQNKRNFKELMN